MTTKDKFEYNCFGETYTCQFATGEYGNGNRALEIMGAEGTPEEGDPIIRVTVNPGQAVPKDCIAIKDYSENEGMVEFCQKLGIIAERVTTIPSGWVEIPVYKLSDSGLEIFNPEQFTPFAK